MTEAVAPEVPSCTEIAPYAPLVGGEPTAAKRVLTHSSMEAWGRCETEYKLAYEELITPTEYSAALAVGSGFHAGAEQLHHRLPLEEAFRVAERVVDRFVARARFGLAADATDALDHHVAFDIARVRATLRAWYDRWLVPWTGDDGRQDRDLEVIETEAKVEAALVNPRTKRASRTFTLAGKIDGIVRQRDDERRRSPDGADAWYIYELKSTGEDIDEFADAMQYSAQPVLYAVLAERQRGAILGPLLGTVMDIARKPTIRPKKDETPDAFEHRAAEEYAADPGRFFRRLVLPIDRSRMHEVMANVWLVAQAIRRAEREGYAAKSGPSCRGSYGPCRYIRLCRTGDQTGYVTKEAAHEELIDEA
jgi:hypothetical protein